MRATARHYYRSYYVAPARAARVLQPCPDPELITGPRTVAWTREDARGTGRFGRTGYPNAPDPFDSCVITPSIQGTLERWRQIGRPQRQELQ